MMLQRNGSKEQVLSSNLLTTLAPFLLQMASRGAEGYKYPRCSTKPGAQGYEIEYNLLGEAVYICKAEVGCTYRSKTAVNARDHVNSRHFKKLIRCNQCPMAYLRYKQFQHHFVTKHQKTAYQCTFDKCKYKTYMADDMVDHYKVKHDSDDVPEQYRPIDPSIPPVECGTPGFKGFKRKQPATEGKSSDRKFIVSQAVISKDHEGKPCSYRCKECGFDAPNVTTFVSHYKDNHQQPMQQCPMCDLETVWPSYLRTHLVKVHKAKM